MGIIRQVTLTDYPLTVIKRRQELTSVLKMGRYHRVGGFFWLLCGIGIVVGALSVPRGTMRNPGPGFLPLCMGGLLSLLSGVLILKDLLKTSSKGKQFWVDRKQWSKVVSTLAAMVFYVWAMPTFGFLAATLVLMIFLFKFVGEMTWKSSLSGGLLVSVCAYLLFEITLKVQFPAGFWQG